MHRIILGALLACAVAACGSDESLPPGGAPGVEIQSYELLTDVICVGVLAGHVYYIKSEEAYYYCDGSDLQPLDLGGEQGPPGPQGEAGADGFAGFRSYGINHAAGVLILTLPDGSTDSLVAATVTNDTTQVSPGGYLAVRNPASGSVDSRLYINIENGDPAGEGIACSLFHDEDDSPRKDWYFATDLGNNHTDVWGDIWGVGVWVPTFVLSRAGDSGVVVPENVSLSVLCY